MGRRWIALIVVVTLSLIGTWGCKKTDVPMSIARVFIQSQRQIGSFGYASGEQTEIKASDYAGVDKDHVIVRKPNLGSVIGSTISGGKLTATLPAGGVDVILLRDGSRYSAVENGRLPYGRYPIWNWKSDIEYTPTAEEIFFIEGVSGSFSGVFYSVVGIIYGSLTKVNIGGTIQQKWYYEPGGAGAIKVDNIIAYNAARLSPNTALAKSVVWEELFEMCTGLDDILGKDSRLTICDNDGNLNQEGKDLLLYVFAKE